MRSDPMCPNIYTVEKMAYDTHDTFTLELVAQQENQIVSFMPGQFNMMYLFGVGEVPISISGDCERRDALTHTIRAVGTVTNEMSKLQVGQHLGIRGPYGSYWPIHDATGKDILLIAGGIGLAPLRPVIYHIIANRSSYNNVTVLYGARSCKDLLYQQQWEEWQQSLNFKVTVDSGSNGDWNGHVGVVTNLITRKDFAPHNVMVMVCGPEIMMHFSIRELLRREVKMDDIYVSMERNMQCAVGYCGHCQYGAKFVCKDGPVFCYADIQDSFRKREL
ncbi:FAD/NAD(P)-binding protein [Candidatus Uabimicrobium amorphum]|uniref:Ni/Fe hydrogenase subunit gamma n=1 Tax=Uabimicrobium amorphum TaxID=2596890 RepID=A0A5S9IU90_UABAM|nr:FAD/NAD(P)-binding protein [Candidatus Uabimicrobium amorphum]BBM88248.1 Ni/Fe hydrogenase subunit gamma [Candidatus Uabimicrobium amorphum]